jgi:hypothetical protein
MKRCTSCQQTYTDDALSFCPADGTRLVSEKSSTPDLQATIMAPPPSAPPPLSQSFVPDAPTGYETTPPSTSDFQTPAPPMQTPSWESIPSVNQQFAPPAQDTKQSKPMAAYITIGASIVVAGFLLLIWLIGLIAGIGGSLIHLLFVLALLVGFIGIAAGVFMLVTSKKH